MSVREATAADAASIRDVATKSMLASYTAALDEDTIEEAVEEWYGGDRIEQLLELDTEQFLVAEREGTVVGFAEMTVSDATDVGAIQWLHVDPDHRDAGVGTDLLDAAEDLLLEHGVSRIEGAVLAANETGATFYEDHGYVRGADQETTIAGKMFTERRYLQFPEGERQALTEARQTDEGTVYIALDEHEIGSKGDFYVAYTDVTRDNRYGYYCDNCGSVDTTMDTMGKIECNDCANKRKPTRWDDAYL
ncbi:MAG: GNAT family N-acetyltransferase [Halanaeroarchaeum sp.]